MRALVTGATGFVGSNLTRALLARGDAVRVLLRKQVSAPATGAAVHVGDLGDPNSIAAAATDCDVIFHCAGESSSHASAEALAWLNVAGTENTIAAARHAGVGRLVLLSCADVSLANRDRIHWREQAALGQAPLGALARSKMLTEEIALLASDRRLEVTAVRPAWLWGPGERHNMPALCAEAAHGGVRLFSSGDHLFASTHIENLIHALLRASITAGLGGQAMHIADAETLTAREFFEPWCKAIGLGRPRRGVYPLAYAAAWTRRRLQASGSWPEDVARRGRGCLLDCERALRLLAYQPTITVEAGLRDLAEWSQRVGGPAAITQLAPTPADAREVARLRKLATDLS